MFHSYKHGQFGKHTICISLTHIFWLAGVQHYNEVKGISICEFLPPHLTIYVDLPAEEVQKKLKQSGKVMRHTETTGSL